MEILLLWADELDDALAVLRHYAARILGLFVAIALFAATGFAAPRAHRCRTLVKSGFSPTSWSSG
jgi:hypothetical protein